MREGIQGGQLKIFEKEDLDKIHLAVLRVLEDLGILIQHESALKLLENAGANVNYAKQLARIPEYLVEESIRKAPRSVRCAGINPKNDFYLKGTRAVFGPGEGNIYVYDLTTGERRFSRLKDMEDAAKLVDSLPNIDFVMGLGSAQDGNQPVVGLEGQAAMMCNTEKHSVLYCHHGEALTRDQLRIAELIVGGEEELRKKPLATLYAEPSSPLFVGTEYIEATMVWAEAGQPVVYAPCTQQAATAPITMVGTLVQGAAESLSGNVVMQLINPGTPFIFGLVPIVIDIRTGVANYGGPDPALLGIGLAQLAQYYQLPSWGTGCVCDAKILDGQALSEATMNLMTATMAGQNLIHDIGYLAAGTIGSFELITIADRLVSQIQHLLKEVIVDDETLSLEAIFEAGHGGNYLANKQTLRLLRTGILWISELYDKSVLDRWQKEGAKTLQEKAREKSLKLIQEHDTEIVPQDIRKEIDEIIKEAIRRTL